MLVASSCTPSAISQATTAANAVAVFSEGAHETLATSYQSEQEECVEQSPSKDEARACVATVRASYSSAWEAYRGMRFAWLGLASSIQSAKLANSNVGLVELLVMISRLASMQESFRHAIQPLVSKYDK